MTDPVGADLIDQLISREVQHLPIARRREFRYLLGRLAVETGAMEMTNDVLPEGGMRLVLHVPGTKRTFVAERPKDWTPEEEERRLGELRNRFLREVP